MVGMYIFDTNAISTLAYYYPARFPTIWRRIQELVEKGNLWSVREVRKELDRHCPSDHLKDWVHANRSIFRIPNEEENRILSEIFENQRYLSLVKKDNILKGFPAADPFVIAAGKAYEAIVITQEIKKLNAVTIPNACDDLEVRCLNLEHFLEIENLTF